VVSETLERATSERGAVHHEFQSAYETLPEEERKQIENCLGGLPAVFVGFPASMAPGKWRRAVRPLLAALVARSRARGDYETLREGPVPVWRIPELRRFVTDVEIRRSTLGRPFFGVTELSKVSDETPRMLETKFAKRYVTTAPIELLLYFIAAPPPSELTWRLDILDYLEAHLPRSPFRRVWLFNWFERAVIIVYPPSFP